MPSVHDKRYCEIGFSAAVTPVRADLSGLRDSGGTLGGSRGGAHGALIEMQRMWPGRCLCHGGDVGMLRDAEMGDAGVGIPGREVLGVGRMLRWECQDGKHWGGGYLSEDALGGCQGAPRWC